MIWIVAVLPIVWLFFSMCVFRHPGHIACPVGLVLSAALAFFVWGQSPDLLGTSVLEGVAFALWPILLVVLAAMILFRYSESSGGMARIRVLLSGVSADKRILALVLAWGFGGFLEGISGFGIPVLIPGAILVALGFTPMSAIVVCLIANTAPTPFAQIGIPALTLSGVTGLDALPLGVAVAQPIFIPSILIPFLLVIVAGGGLRALKGVVLVTLISGLSFALPVYAFASLAGPELPTLAGSVCAIVCTILASKRLCRDTSDGEMYRLPKIRATEPQRVGGQGAKPALNRGVASPDFELSAMQACLPFILVFALVLATNIVAPLHDLLAQFRTEAVIYSGSGARPLTFAWALTPGVLILVATILSCFLQRQSFRRLLASSGAVLASARNMIVTIVSIIAIAKVMSYSGMTNEIAIGLVSAFGVTYPLIAPVVGMLGAFITGSDTTCCVLFGGLQTNAAMTIGADPTWVAASNLSGASIGKMISPQSIAVGLGIGGLDGKEGDILKRTIGYGLIAIVVICVTVYCVPAPLFARS
jgi:lactate permease